MSISLVRVRRAKLKLAGHRRSGFNTKSVLGTARSYDCADSSAKNRLGSRPSDSYDMEAISVTGFRPSMIGLDLVPDFDRVR